MFPEYPLHDQIDWAFHDIAKRVCDLTAHNSKDPFEMKLSFFGELGELSDELKIVLGVAGTQHKQPGSDGVFGECADVLICGIAMRYTLGGRIQTMPAGEDCPSNDVHYNRTPIPLVMAKVKLGSITIWAQGNDQYGCYFSFEQTVLGIALGIDPDIGHFINTINAKLNKWAKNVNFSTT